MGKCVVAVLLALAVACSDPLIVRIGDVRLSVATTGADLDPDGYSVALDGGTALAVAVNDTRMLPGLPAGSHSFLLSGLAANCTVSGANPWDIDVGSHETTEVSFAVACAALPPLNIAGVWDWTEQYVNPVCHDTGTYAFTQSGATFTGRSDQVGICETSYGPSDNTSSGDPVSGGSVAGGTMNFLVGASGQCSYTATITGTPPDHLSGTTICGSATGTWEAVRGQPVAAITVTPAHETLLEGATVQLAAQLWSAAGHRVFRQPVAWSSDNPAVATVSDSGKVAAIAVGSATITVTADGKSASAAIIVPLTGFVRVTTATTGVDPDPDGYLVNAWGGGRNWSTFIPTNGTVTLTQVLPGDHTVQLSGEAVNCQISGANPRSVSVPAGDTVAVEFDVACAEASVVAFTSTRDGDAEIYTVKTNGAQLTRLTTNPAWDGGPAWSPDGTKLAFHSGRDGNSEIYVMNADGSALTRLTTDPTADYSPAWSPDGARIAFVATRDGDPEIYVMNADGSNPTRLTTDPAYDLEPAWSPDGTKIAFQSSRGGSTDIYGMNADGSGLRRVTTGPFDQQPAWSPDGAKIVFTAGDCFYYECTFDVSVVNADGSGRLRLAVDGSWGYPTQPAWSPDGKKILFVAGGTYCDDWDCYDYANLLVMHADGTGIVTLQSGYDVDPAWRP